MPFSFKPSGADDIDVSFGVKDFLSGYIVQNKDANESAETLTIQDQQGRVCQVIAYDAGTTLSFTMIGSSTAPCAVGDAITIDNNQITITTVTSQGSAAAGSYIVQSVRRACVYNDTAKWQIDATGWAHAKYKNFTEVDIG